MKLVDALRQNDTVTENGMSTNSSSLNHCVDLFFMIGAMRGQDKDRLIRNFSLALLEDSTRAMKILFWVRDVRGGAGERQIFRDVMQFLAEDHTDFLRKNIPYISEFGRWDDLLTLVGTKLETEALTQIRWGLDTKSGLCSKWMPRKGPIAAKLRTFLEMSPKQYRKTLVELTHVVETQMCANEWENIDFGKLPSVASARYQKAFWKRNEEGYKSYIASLQKGEAKINAGAVYPYDVTKSLQMGNSDVAIEQWKALPNYMEGSEDRILPVVDVSGSMQASAGGNKNVSCMDVSISLGLYISERNTGSFKDAFVTFSAEPKLHILKGNLRDRFAQLQRAEWGFDARGGLSPDGPPVDVIFSDTWEESARAVVWEISNMVLSGERDPGSIAVLCTQYRNMFGMIGRLLELEDIPFTQVGRPPYSQEVVAGSVTISTIHSAKGYEYEVVFLIGVDNLPYKKSESEEEIESQRHLAYVGATRAKDHLYVMYSKSGELIVNLGGCDPGTMQSWIYPTDYPLNEETR